MADRDTIHQYLKSLSKYLARLEKPATEDVIREIESHIYDALEQREKEGNPASVEAILAGFGDPRDLAASYVEHMLEGTAPPKGFRAIQRVKKGATRGLFVATALVGFGFSLALLVTGIAKIFEPDMVGLWTTESANSVMMGIRHTPSDATELLGWWIVPIALGLGLGLAYWTKRLLWILKDKL